VLVVFLVLLLIQGVTPWLAKLGFGRLPGDFRFKIFGKEFFITITVTIVFATTIGLETFTVVTGGLLIGGLLAAPFGAMVAKRIQPRLLLFAVSIVLIATSLFSLYKALT
jgi:ABC-type phosphate/phosphonate transport system permease subunit